jgi:hypothetical protein
MRRLVRPLTALTLGSLIGGCDDPLALPPWRETCESAGLCAKAAAPPELDLLLCDSSEDSSCNRENLEKTLELTLERAATRPGTHVQLSTLGETVGSTKLLAEQVSPTPKSRVERTKRKEEQRWTAHAREVLSMAASPIFASAQPRRSPLAESITKLVMATDELKLPRRIIVPTDGREVSRLANFECGPLPTEAVWLARLDRHGLLRPDSLKGVQVSFTFLGTTPSSRCSMSLSKETSIRQLWEVALTRAGANVSFTSGPVQFTDPTPPQNLATKE